MSEGRKTKIVLLDDRHLDILVKPKLLATELYDLVASHFNLKEKEYFGLMFKDETNHNHWLQWDRRVLEHDFPRRSGQLVLYFAVRFFIENISSLQDSATVELFYLQARQSVFHGLIDCDSDSVFQLAAFVLHAVHGDYVDVTSAKEQLKKLAVLPTQVLQEHPCLSYCEDQVISRYQKLSGYSRGLSIVSYMAVVEGLPTYGIHYYEVKDKSGIPWWLGISYKGISLYDHNDRKTPRRVFAWKQLENLYFRDRKFSIEVHDPKRVVHTLSNFNLYEDAVHESLDDFDDLSDAISDPTTLVSVSRRTFGPSSVNVHAWLAATAYLTKCIWTMAVAQHQFYLDRKQSELQCATTRSMRDIATDLSRSTSSLHSSAASDGTSNIFHRSSSARSLNTSLSNSRTELGLDCDSELSRSIHRDLWVALKSKKDALEAELKAKLAKLKELCLKEAELTGELPADTPLEPGEPRPTVRRRVGTSFALSPKVVSNRKHKADPFDSTVSKLESEFDLQGKITAAYLKLSKDSAVSKSIRRDRQQCYRKAYSKLKILERMLNESRLKAGKPLIQVASSFEDPSALMSPAAVRRRANSQCNANRGQSSTTTGFFGTVGKQKLVAANILLDHSPDTGYVAHRSLQRNMSAPSSPIRLQVSNSVFADIDSNHPRTGDHLLDGRHTVSGTRYRATRDANRLTETERLSRAGHNPYSHRSANHASSYNYNNTELHAEYLRREDNLYHVVTNRSTSYSSGETLPTSASATCSPWDDMAPGWPSKHSSLEGAYRRQVSCDAAMHRSNLSSSCLTNSRVNDISERAGEAFPRSFASIPVHYETPPHLRTAVDTSCESIELSPQVVDGSTVVTRGQNYVEISKPFEMADVYKYSSRLRRTTGSSGEAITDMRATSSPQLSTRDKHRNQMVSKHGDGWSQQHGLTSNWLERTLFK